MANDSSTGGYLSPWDVLGSEPVQDFALDAIFQKIIVGLTGLPGSLVRPRWQPTMPRIPEPSVDWCAIGVTQTEPDNAPVFIHQATYGVPVGTADGSNVISNDGYVEATNRNGQDLMLRQKVVTLLASFYGPNGMNNAEVAADGLYVCQNEGILGASDMALVDVSAATPTPDLVNQQWVRRFDISIRVRRQIRRTYDILNLLEIQGSINADGSVTDISTS